jgi:ubiquinone/menaquinone biosynthesis C-methylase UbiE
MKCLFRALAFLFGFLAGLGTGFRIALRLARAATPPQLAPFLDSPVRHLYRDPSTTLDFIGIHRNAVVLDAGCGTGTFTLEAARRAGSGGRVHAVDQQAAMINILARKLERAGIDNVSPEIGALEYLALPANSVDAAYMISAFSEVRDRAAVLQSLKRALKPGGSLVVAEDFLSPQFTRPAGARRWIEAAGFKLTGRQGNALCYMLKFVKPISALAVVTTEVSGA